MHPNLQIILDFIQQDVNLSAEEKNKLSTSLHAADKELELTAFKLDRTEKVKRTTAILLEETIEELEHKRKAVEAQNRELEIESSLERVRTVAMSMNKPDDMLEVCKTIALQLQLLGVKEIRNVQTAIFYPARGTYMNYEFYAKHDQTFVTETVYTNHAVANAFAEQMFKDKGEVFITHLKDKEVKDWLVYQKSTNVFIDSFLENATSLSYYWHSLGPVALGISTYVPLSDEDLQLFQRFLKVFDLSYRRYLDIEKAIAQSKEAQIQLALERVRARTMAMQLSDELPDAANILFQQMQTLGMPAWSAGYCIWDDDHQAITLWMSSAGIIQKPFRAPVTEDPSFIHFYDAWKRGETFYVEEIGGEAIVSHYKYMCRLPVVGEMLNKFIADGGSLPAFQIFHLAFFSQGFLLFITYEPVPESHDIFKRFGNVFDQTYTRFLDLQKAEAQAKEARIEAALERVRSRSMAMHKSDELLEAAEILFVEMQKLGIESLTAGYVLIDKEEKNGLNYTPNPSTKKILPLPIIIPHNETIHLQQVIENWKKGNPFLIVEMDEGETIKHQTFIAERSTNFPLNAAQLIAISPSRLFLHNFYFKEGYVLIVGGTKLSAEQTDIMLRFTKVFQQAYTRFLDLQKAEAQAREAKIEAALERVRATSMAMHKSGDLLEVIKTVTDQLVYLGISFEGSNFVTVNPDKSWLMWICTKEEKFPFLMHIPYFNHREFIDYEAAKIEGRDFYTYVLSPEENADWMQHFFEKATPKTSLPDITNERRQQLIQSNSQASSISLFNKIVFAVFRITNQSFNELENIIFKRIGKVFEQAYTRFLDLQKAEAQAKEAQIEAALEKVRSRTLAMQKSDELSETAAEVFRQLISLGIEPNRLYIGIVKEESGDMEMWATDEDGTQVGKKFMFNKNENVSVKKLFDGWKAKEKSVIVDMQGKELEDYFHYLNNVMHIPFKGGLTQKRRVQSVAYFSKGFIGMASPDGQGNETIQLLERFAAVFNLTFTRFNDLKIAEAHAEQAEQDLIAIKEAKQKAEEALTELQATQKQLIQSEKMASLGELTAGIAHEIQNPLNFVNNFSEVSNELMDEMNAEIEKGDLEEAKLIALDIKQNLEKINHHGKRADAIVKGMLQHSRSSSATKEPTDINKLADEYLRLAYHGLRAKDKSFNATLQTDYDETIGNINIIPQDMGRVILNLITNAFYVVDEKKKSGIEGYEPTVSVSSKKIADTILISVKDNGNGIPQKILDKIFQPFFTTKPTGQGTGLGLSLSYDIVKAHGGELKVETKEGQGTTFIIKLSAKEI